jgi:hypothetical protein
MGRYRQSFRQRLGNEQAVERVSMVQRKVFNGMSVFDFYGQLFKGLAVQNSAKIRRDIKLAQGLFDPDFPNDGRT